MSNKRIHLDESRFTPEELTLIKRAQKCASAAHKGQLRKSGEPYITHPVAVAQTVADWGLDAEAIAAALLHDTVEDTDMTIEDVATEFSDSMAALVDGLTKLAIIEKMPQASPESFRLESTNENLRKLLLASSEDLRVLLIKLADRRHNLQTLGYLPPAKRLSIARESLEIYAPLAYRLGMGQLKGEIEDLSFLYSLPDEYAALSKQVGASTKNSERYIVRLRHEIGEILKTGGVETQAIEGRQKQLYSIYKKLSKVDGDINKLYDLIAVRIIVPDVASCYQALGLLHQQFKPLIYRIKDYIAAPKTNGYRSLHTTVFALDGNITEIQIRTPEMHQEAELGLAAHFYYDAQKGTEPYRKGSVIKAMPRALHWVSTLNELRVAGGSQAEFVEDAKFELFSDRIFVFSPKGDLYDLPEGSTPIDFAFAIHSQVGLKTLGAKVNSKLVTLDTKLENRDVVEIMTRRVPSPNRDWLTFVRTPHARNSIRAWFRAASRETNVASGRTLLEPELRAWSFKRIEDIPKPVAAGLFDTLSVKGWDDVLALLGEGSLSVSHVLRRLFPVESGRPANATVITRPAATGRVLVQDEKLPYTLAPCCIPAYPEHIIGYVTRGKGVTVHRRGCNNLPTDSDRLVACQWELDKSVTEHILCELELIGLNRVGLLRDVTSSLAKRGVNISGMTSNDLSSDESTIRFKVEVSDLYELALVLRMLERIAGVRVVNSLNT